MLIVASETLTDEFPSYFYHGKQLTCTGGDSFNKGCFGRKTNLFRESGDFAGNRETWENFREI